MPSGEFHCPSCTTLLRTPEPVPPGTKIKCPKCGGIFAANETVAPAAAVHAVMPRARQAPEPPYEAPRRRREPEYDEPKRPRYEQEYDEAENTYRPRRKGLSGLSAKYSIDLGEWFGYATTHYSAVLGPMIGFSFIYLFAFLGSAIPYLGLLIFFFVKWPMQAGFTAVSLKQLKGQDWSFGDFFTGFQHYGTMLLFALLLLGVILCGMLPAALVAGAAAVLSAVVRGAAPVFLLAAGVFYLFNLLALIYVFVRVTAFAVPLIVDRHCGAIEAMQGSWALTRGHFLGAFGTLFLLGLIDFGGALMCYVGLLFTIPLTYLVWNAGYLLIAGTKPPVSSTSSRYDEERDYQDRYYEEQR